MADGECTVELIDEATGRSLTISAKPGETLLDIAQRSSLPIEHSCGGVCACATCHVWVERGMDRLKPAADAELDQLEQAPSARLESRLACQAALAKPGHVVCRIPRWNRNAASHDHP